MEESFAQSVLVTTLAENVPNWAKMFDLVQPSTEPEVEETPQCSSFNRKKT